MNSSSANAPNVAKTMADIAKALSDWYLCFVLWAATHYVLGVSSTICAVVAAAYPDMEENKFLLGYVAIATAVLTFLKAQQKNNAYITAWRNLRATRMAYYAGTASLNNLVDCYRVGEEMIGKHD